MKGLRQTAKELFKTTKGKAILGGAAVTVAGAAVAISLLLSDQGYRTIAVQEVNGTGIVQNEKQGSKDAYAGMHLNSGDDVTVREASDMTLLLDMDKYVYAEENTHFWLEADGDSETSKTYIYLDQGAELNRLSTKLTEGEEYKVDTPNSVMAVRGTVFRVCVYYDSDGIAWASVEVFDGYVEVSLKTLEGEFNGVTETVGPGEAVLIRASNDFSEFVADENNEVKRSIDYEDLPQGTATKLVEFIDEGDVLCIGKELLMDYAKLEEHKTEEVIAEEATCTKEGKKEICCSVCNEVVETVVLPMLPHEVSDTWDIVTEPDCVNTGSEQRVCSVCGEVVETRLIDALGHTPGRLIVTSEATCTQEGESVQRCTVCNAILRTEKTAAIGHVAGDWQTVSDATCSSGGEMVKTCTRCGAVMETESTDALGHNYGDWSQTTAATCTTPGIQSRTCAACGDVETAETVLSGHKCSGYDHVIDDEALSNLVEGISSSITLQATGKCSVCGAAIVKQHTITLKPMQLGEQTFLEPYCNDCGDYLAE